MLKVVFEQDTSLDEPAPLMRWNATCECPVCQSNSNVVRAKGLPFPSGHTSAPAHDGCTCACVPLTQEKRLPNDVDELVEFNPYHGQHGRFASGQGGGSSGTTEPERANHAALSALEQQMSEKFPQTHFDFTGTDPELMQGVSKRLEMLMTKYPEVGKSIAYIGTGKDAPPLYGVNWQQKNSFASMTARIEANPPYQVMNLNPTWFGSPSRAGQEMMKLERLDASPPGTGQAGMEAVVTHEFGHAIDTYLQGAGQRMKARPSSDVATDIWQFKAINEQAGHQVSYYAQKHVNEAFAEAFASLHFTPPAQQASYTKKLGKFLDKTLPGGSSASWKPMK